MRYRLFILTLLFPTLFLWACGYRFVGDVTQPGQQWANTTITMEGAGTDANPVLAQQIKDRLRTLLSPSGQSSDAPKRSLRIQLDPTYRVSILETSSGRSDQFELTIKVHPVLLEGGTTRRLPTLTGTSRYYEPKAGASTDAVRIKAEKEALDQVIDSLATLLITYP
ncbi:MAG: hypothetical protein HQL78_13005 [Magnetococcales bacterium]|nr:hypothetical protein [Magnetococcales bacterium]